MKVPKYCMNGCGPVEYNEYKQDTYEGTCPVCNAKFSIIMIDDDHSKIRISRRENNE